jgi:hypothetical protein
MEKWNPRNEYLSDLYRLRNWHVAEIAEIDMAISRERNNPNAKKLRTSLQEARQAMNRLNGQQPNLASINYEALAEAQDQGSMHVTDKSDYAFRLRQQADIQNDVRQQSAPPYEQLIQ